VSTAKSLFIRRESDVWESLWSQWAALTEANERLAQRIRLLCDELKSESVAAQTEAASARTEALSAWEQDGFPGRGDAAAAAGAWPGHSEQDQFRSQAAEAVSRAEALGGQLAEATERLAEATAWAATLVEGLVMAVGSA
jgi:hypothetical protein